jgi:hypothetical protein
VKKRLKILQEILEIVPGSEGVKLQSITDSMDVQLDRWRLEQREHNHEIVVIHYDLHTDVDISSPDAVVNTMSVLYCRAEDLRSYGVCSAHDPIAYQLYRDIFKQIGRRTVTGRTLFLCPSYLAMAAGSADVELSAESVEDLDPESFGDSLYDVVVADGVFSMVPDTDMVLTGIKAALHKGGRLLVVDRGYVARSSFCGFSLDGLRGLLRDFTEEKSGCAGNALGVVHKIMSADQWLPLAIENLQPDPECPVYVWALVKHD